jgi:CHAT domain
LKAAQLDAGSVKLAGTRLFDALMANPHIQPHLTTALQVAAGTRHPISIEIATRIGAEALPWEAMCSADGDFLGLDERWSLARMVEPQVEAAPVYTLTPPLRIAAVLSCLDIPAAGELDALRMAIRETDHRNIELLIVASEEQLILDVKAEIDSGTAPEVSRLEIMPDNLDGLHRLIADFGPHVLHFFCHGSLEGSPHIAIAKKEDWSKTPRISSITAEATEFGGFTRRTDDDLPWLVVLNCCEGAGVNAASDSQSLALSLALNAVAPAVVGMREPVVDTTANQLTEALYTRLLTDLIARIDAATGSPEPLDWPRVVVAARDRLARVPGKPRSEAAASIKEWTLPVIYVRPDEFKLQVVPAVELRGPHDAEILERGGAQETARAARLEIQALRALLADLPPRQADALKADAIARIEELSAELGVDPAPPDGP